MLWCSECFSHTLQTKYFLNVIINIYAYSGMYVCSYNEKLCGQYLYNLIHCYEIYYLFEKIITGTCF